MEPRSGRGGDGTFSGDAVKIILTSDWSPEKFAPYGPAVTAAMHKLRDKFPREVTVEKLADDIMRGKRQLWLILTEEDEFISFVLSEIQINDATGLKTILIPSMAGEDGPESVPLISEIERYGKEQGCDESKVYGRWGWKRPLEAEGYKMDMVVFRKPL